jgi:hypothetical protein
MRCDTMLLVRFLIEGLGRGCVTDRTGQDRTGEPSAVPAVGAPQVVSR